MFDLIVTVYLPINESLMDIIDNVNQGTPTWLQNLKSHQMSLKTAHQILNNSCPRKTPQICIKSIIKTQKSESWKGHSKESDGL